MQNDDSFLSEMTAFLRKVRAHAPALDGSTLTSDFSFALGAGLEAARNSRSVTEAVATALSAADGRDAETRGAAAMAAFIAHAYVSGEDPCPRV